MEKGRCSVGEVLSDALRPRSPRLIRLATTACVRETILLSGLWGLPVPGLGSSPMVPPLAADSMG